MIFSQRSCQMIKKKADRVTSARLIIIIAQGTGPFVSFVSIFDFHFAALEMAAGSGVESQKINGDYAGYHESHPRLE